MIVGCGVDVIEIARVERALARRGDALLRRVFTPAEVEDCLALGRSGAQFALRFAAKEAAMKAVGTGWAQGVGWRDVETRLLERDRCAAGPRRFDLQLHGRARERAALLGGLHAHLAASCSRTHALALVVLEGPRP